MSKEFYNYIARHIISYLKTNDESIQHGTRYFLKLDNQAMVSCLDTALHDLSSVMAIRGTWVYKPNIYDTYTIRLNHAEIAIVAKTDDMTEDFLATLRNAKVTMLMITSAPIDSIKKGAGDLAAKGMPFYKDTIIENIENYISSSSLSSGDKAVLRFELERRKDDVFSDKSSLFEYEGLLSIVNGEKVTEDNFGAFRLLFDDALAVVVTEKELKTRLRENNGWYERIERSIRFGNIEDDFEKLFDIVLIKDLMTRKKNPDAWDAGLKYTDILNSLEKKKKAQNKPFEEEGHEVYAGVPAEYRFEENVNLFFRSDGTTASKQRKQNVVIFNTGKKENIILELLYNRLVRKDSVICNNGDCSISGKTVRFNLERYNQACSFHDIKIEDENSLTKYEYRICVIDIAPEYLSSVMTSYSVIRKRKSGFLRIIGSAGDIIINTGHEITNTFTISEGETYSCHLEGAICLHIDENSMTVEKQGLTITLDLGGVAVPVKVVDEPKVKIIITGLNVFKKKYAQEGNFIITGENAIAFGTDEFYTKEDFRQNLVYEQEFVKRNLYCATRVGTELNEKNLMIPETVRQAYNKFVGYFNKNNLIPSLSFYSNELATCAREYVALVFEYMDTIDNGLPIIHETNDLLKLGMIYGDDGACEICLTPFHPLNVAYQLSLRNEKGVGGVRDEFAARLSCANLMPYIRNEKKEIYRVAEQRHSPEWVYYTPITDKHFRGARGFVPKLIAEKIEEYIDHFNCLFNEIGNKVFKVNVFNMGNCKEVMYGLVRFIAKSLQRNSDPDNLMEFIVNIYSDQNYNNEFLALTNLNILSNTYRASEVKFDSSFSTYDITNILSQKIKCYFHSEGEERYEYAHISFYEMDSSKEPSVITSVAITSGVMLNGILSGVPSVFYGNEFKTGFGRKYAAQTPLLEFASCYNALCQVANTSNPYYMEQCISTAVERVSVEKMDKIYDSSNWVTFVDPKVDLNFFLSESNSDVLIIHYSDQYTSSSGYDAITVTRKSKQYEDIISEYLTQKAVSAPLKSIRRVIDMFNAINGDWLLKLISSNSYFPREKMSILSAIKAALAYYYHPEIIWVPISLEELLRVSGATGLSAYDGVLSAKKLGFEDGRTSDDILLIGIEKINDRLMVYIRPIEVKIGHTDALLEKAKEQIKNTTTGLLRALCPDEDSDTLQSKMVRNFIMQLTVISSEKMKLYHIWDEQNWDKVLVEYREALLNENYEISSSIYKKIGNGGIIAFNHDSVTRFAKFEDEFEIIEMTELDGINYMVQSVAEIRNAFDEQKDIFNNRLAINYKADSVDLENTPKVKVFSESKQLAPEITITPESLHEGNIQAVECGEETSRRIKVLFGIDQSTGDKLIWEPGNTDKVLHTNTGIIGTMGTGKTQFTKSIITQIYRETPNNVNSENIGILIFDYKGDYNESKADFIAATNATVLRLYHLPYNPFTLNQPKVFKPLLPIHVANAFKDTLSKVYSLGAKQENALFNCIKDTYAQKGILQGEPATWDRTPPTFSDIYRIYSEDEGIKKNDSLAAALDKLAGFEIFESDSAKTKSLFDLLNGVVVIDLSGYDPDIQNLVVAITLDLFYAQMQSKGSSMLNENFRQLTKIILVDEADNFLHEGFPSLKKILKEGREFGVGTILSTQFLKHFAAGDDDFSKYILTWVVHNVADLKPIDIRFVFNTETNSVQEQKLFNDVKRLAKHQSIVKMGNSSKPYYIRDKAFWELISE